MWQIIIVKWMGKKSTPLSENIRVQSLLRKNLKKQQG